MEERVAEGSRKVVVIRPGVGVERLARLPPPPPPPADYPHTLAQPESLTLFLITITRHQCRYTPLLSSTTPNHEREVWSVPGYVYYHLTLEDIRTKLAA